MIIVKRWAVYCGIAALFLGTFYLLTGPEEPPYPHFNRPEKPPPPHLPPIPPPPPPPPQFQPNPASPPETNVPYVYEPSTPKASSTSTRIETAPSPAISGKYGNLPAQPSASAPTPSKNGSFKWSDLPVRYPVQSMISYPAGTPPAIPRIQHEFEVGVQESPWARGIREERQARVKEAFSHTWEGYKKHAWLKDEVSPLTGGSKDTFGGWAATLVDTLDTLWIMDMKDEFEEAVNAVKMIDFETTEERTLNVFETTIRYLGGFLGAYDISEGKYPILLEKAREVGEMLYFAFDTPNRLPITRWDWKAAKAGRKQEASDWMLVAELGSLSLEFTRLTQLTKDPKYFDAIQRITNHFKEQQMDTKLPGMWPVVVNGRDASFTSDNGFTLGGMSDSVYEYLPKEYLLLNGLDPDYRLMYVKAMRAIKEHVFFQPMTQNNSKILLSGNARANENSVELDPQGQHLACFGGGMVAMGAAIFDRKEDFQTARQLVEGCIWAYNATPTKIMPETFHVIPCSNTVDCKWDETRWVDAVFMRNTNDVEEGDKSLPLQDQADKKIGVLRLPPGFSAIGDRRYILRPEAIESIFVLYRITGDVALHDKAWKMFEAITDLARTDIAFAALDDVTVPNPPKSDRMESFWTAETLKYYYLLYSDPGLVSLDDYVLNTEAHPLKRPASEA